jgi:hypothetical protein
VAYLLVWPVPVKPVAWHAPVAPGYVRPFARNERLKGLKMLPLAGNHGPETVALDAQGRIYAATHEGRIVRLTADGSNPENWVTTGGRLIQHARYFTLQLAESYLTGPLFRRIVARIERLAWHPT